MIQNIRFNTFETNSSTTHSLTILPIDEFNKFKQGTMYLDWDDKLITYEEAFKKQFDKNYPYEEALQEYLDDMGYENVEECMQEERFNEEQLKLAVFDFANDQAGYNFYSYDLMLGEKQDRFETFECEYTTPNGETIVAFGYYGNDY